MHDWSDFELALTPGIPTEWVRAVRGSHNARLRRQLEQADVQDRIDADIRAASITLEQGWEMLRATPIGYIGAIPIFAQLAMRESGRTAPDIAAELGQIERKVYRWRANQVFDPVTLQRVIRPRGRQQSGRG